MNPYRSLRLVVRFGRVETDPAERRLARTAYIGDLRQIARRRLPGGVFDYVNGGFEFDRSLLGG